MTIPPLPPRIMKPLPPQCDYHHDADGTRCLQQANYTVPFEGKLYAYCGRHAGWYAGLLISGEILWSELLREAGQDE